jgi:DhnA family fructose-bisphosphate aldolase class Ia
MNKVVCPAGKTLVLLSGGGKIRHEELPEHARPALEARVAGFLFSRNQWQSPYEVSLRMTAKLWQVSREDQTQPKSVYPAPENTSGRHGTRFLTGASQDGRQGRR